MIKGLDFSSAQGPNFPFGKAFSEGWAFAIGKVSGGKGYQNEFRETQFANAKAAGMETALYHYMFEPENRAGSGTARQEFENFRAAADRIFTDATPVVLDIEERVATFNPQPNFTEWLVEYQDLCMTEYGRYPVFYVGTYFIHDMNLTDTRLTRSPLWLPSWQDIVPGPIYWRPWEKLDLWQYSSTAKVGGVQPIDANIYYGTAEEFKRLGKPSAVAPVDATYGPFGKTLSGGFRKFYEAEPKALAYWGYPVTDEIQENGRTVQYFERARFEWHPGADPANHDVLLGRLGAEKVGL